MTTCLVTGWRGQLGAEVSELLSRRCSEWSVLKPTRSQLDLSDEDSIKGFLADRRPDVIVNCAAWTAVDAAQSNRAQVRQVNTSAPQTLARYCSRAGSTLIQVSTDYVFEGRAGHVYSEMDPVSPLSYYGITKADAETAVAEAAPANHLIVRTAWLYGESRDNFVYKVSARLREGERVWVVNDQFGSPSYARDVASRLVDLLVYAKANEGTTGVFHAVNGGVTTWFSLARKVADLLSIDADRVRPIETRELELPAPRPFHSVLSDTRAVGLGLAAMPTWEDALSRALPGLLRTWALDG